MFMVNVVAAPVLLTDIDSDAGPVEQIGGETQEPIVETGDDITTRYFNKDLQQDSAFRWFSTTDEFNLPATFLGNVRMDDVPLGLLGQSFSGFRDYKDYFEESRPAVKVHEDPLYFQSQYGSGQEKLEEWLSKHGMQSNDGKPAQETPAHAGSDTPIDQYEYDSLDQREAKQESQRPQAAGASDQLNVWEVDQALQLIFAGGEDLFSPEPIALTPSQQFPGHSDTGRAALIQSPEELDASDEDDSARTAGRSGRAAEMVALAAGATVVAATARGNDDEVEAADTSIAAYARQSQREPARP
jgi:hypothetical protein